MKRRMVFIIFSSILLIFIIACGCGPEVKVNTPSGEIIQSTYTSAPLGTSRDNPAPFGSEVESDFMKFVILGSTRPADDIVLSADMFNIKPEKGQEYLFIQVQITCTKSSDQDCSLSLSELKAVGSLGIEYDVQWLITGVDGLLEGTDFYGGTTISGNLPFIIQSTDTNILFKYEPFFGQSFYMSIP